MNLQSKVESLASQASYAANGGVFVWGAMTFNQLLAAIGMVLALLTFVVNVYFQRRRDERDAEFHNKRMEVKEQTERFAESMADHDDPSPR